MVLLNRLFGIFGREERCEVDLKKEELKRLADVFCKLFVSEKSGIVDIGALEGAVRDLEQYITDNYPENSLEFVDFPDGLMQEMTQRVLGDLGDDVEGFVRFVAENMRFYGCVNRKYESLRVEGNSL